MTQEELKQLYELLLKAEQTLPENEYYKVNLLTNGYQLIGIQTGLEGEDYIITFNPDGTIA